MLCGCESLHHLHGFSRRQIDHRHGIPCDIGHPEELAVGGQGGMLGPFACTGIFRSTRRVAASTTVVVRARARGYRPCPRPSMVMWGCLPTGRREMI